MEVLPESSPPRRDEESLVRFLEYCQSRAIERGRPQFASISLRVKHISPLAVLQSISEPSSVHFYMERPAAGKPSLERKRLGEKSLPGHPDL